MRIVVTGTRGIPNIMGGVETHCEELYPRLVKLGHEVILIRRTCYVHEAEKQTEYKGVKLLDVFAPKKKSIEAFLHTFLAVIKALFLKADVLHIHAIGPALFTPFARLLGLKVVFTHHGPDYDRDKWGKLAKTILKLGEKLGVKYANEVIVISEPIRELIAKKYGRKDSHLIYNGVVLPEKSTKIDYLTQVGVEPKKYVFAMGRFVPEKGFDLLVNAFKASKYFSEYKLVIAGDADHEDDYSKSLKQLAKDNGVVLPGFIKGESLNQLLTNARLFVLPSYHEGLPIALLEAMSYHLDVLVSDIPANKAVGLVDENYFRNRNKDSLVHALNNKYSNATSGIAYNLEAYNWGTITKQTLEVYSC